MQVKVAVYRNSQEEINFTKNAPKDSYTRLDPTWHMKLKAFDTVQLKVDKGILYAYCANRIELSGTLIKQMEK